MNAVGEIWIICADNGIAGRIFEHLHIRHRPITEPGGHDPLGPDLHIAESFSSVVGKAGGISNPKVKNN